LTGSNEGKNSAMINLERDSSNITDDLDKEIESIIAKSKF
jgi:hypothetical protein